MKPITAVVLNGSGRVFRQVLLALTKSDLIDEVLVIGREAIHPPVSGCRLLMADPRPSHRTLQLALERVRTRHLLLLTDAESLIFDSPAFEKVLERAESIRAGWVYSDFYEGREPGKSLHPLNDYQPGSVRDDFDFGAVVLLEVSAVRDTIRAYGLLSEVTYAGLYDLRLKLSIDNSIHHLKDPLYTALREEKVSGTEKIFAYLDPDHRAIQKEMEAVFTGYVKKIGAYLPPSFEDVEPTSEEYPVEASVVIPVRNRKETITDALRNALSQRTDFPFNVIVVDNHSTDGTTTILSDLAKAHPSLKHIIPKRGDLNIGGCWNEALHASDCGRFAVQLDSDDLYSSPDSLKRIVEMFRQGNYGMVIGSYTLVDFNLKEISPGLIDHREWTDENGHNNALRINGLGAPRAFHTSLMRKIGFLNVSYGEDYAAALRICRQYRIGRIYEPLYLCRRWPGNTDADLSLDEANRNDAFKDRIRTDEIFARQRMNQGG